MSEDKPVIAFYVNRYGPAYTLAQRILRMRMWVTAVAGVGIVATILYAYWQSMSVNSETTAPEALISIVGIVGTGWLVVTILTIVATLLRIYVDLAVNMAPGLTPQERYELMERW